VVPEFPVLVSIRSHTPATCKHPTKIKGRQTDGDPRWSEAHLENVKGSRRGAGSLSIFAGLDFLHTVPNPDLRNSFGGVVDAKVVLAHMPPVFANHGRDGGPVVLGNLPEGRGESSGLANLKFF